MLFLATSSAGFEAPSAAINTPNASIWPASIIRGVVAEKPGGRPLRSTRIGPSKSSIRWAVTLNSLALPAINRQVCAVERDLEIRATRADRERIAEIGPLQAANVLDFDQIFAVGRGREIESRVFAQLSVAVVVVVEIEREDGQAVGDELGSGRVGLDDVARLAQ